MSASLAMDNPLLDSLGARLVEWRPDVAVFELDMAPRHLNRQGSLQGGVAAALLDAACGYAGLLDDQGAARDAVTAMLSISYLARASQGRVRASGRVTGGGRRLYFSHGELRSEDGRLLATAQGSFKRQGAR